MYLTCILHIALFLTSRKVTQRNILPQLNLSHFLSANPSNIRSESLEPPKIPIGNISNTIKRNKPLTISILPLGKPSPKDLSPKVPKKVAKDPNIPQPEILFVNYPQLDPSKNTKELLIKKMKKNLLKLKQVLTTYPFKDFIYFSCEFRCDFYL